MPLNASASLATVVSHSPMDFPKSPSPDCFDGSLSTRFQNFRMQRHDALKVRRQKTNSFGSYLTAHRFMPAPCKNFRPLPLAPPLAPLQGALSLGAIPRLVASL